MIFLVQSINPHASVTFSHGIYCPDQLSSVSETRADVLRRIRSSQGGFSLLEMIAVVAIIGVLAAVAIPRYQQYVARSQVSSAYMILKGQQVGVEDLLLRGETPSLERLSYSGEEVTHAHGKWKMGSEGSLRYTFGEGASPLLAKGSWLELKPSNDVQGWVCSADPALSKELTPSGCVANNGN